MATVPNYDPNAVVLAQLSLIHTINTTNSSLKTQLAACAAQLATANTTIAGLVAQLAACSSQLAICMARPLGNPRPDDAVGPEMSLYVDGATKGHVLLVERDQ